MRAEGERWERAATATDDPAAEAPLDGLPMQFVHCAAVSCVVVACSFSMLSCVPGGMMQHALLGVQILCTKLTHFLMVFAGRT